MSVFRIEKDKHFTTMSNHHFYNKKLSMKAKGVLSQLLSLPDDFTLTLKGLASMSRDGVDSIRSAVDELEKEGYITRGERTRNDKGELQGMEYVVREKPEMVASSPTLENPMQVKNDTKISKNNDKKKADSPVLENPMLDNPILGNPIQANPMQENPTLLNTNYINNKTDLSVSQCAHMRTHKDGRADRKQPTVDIEKIEDELRANARIEDFTKPVQRDFKGNVVKDAKGQPVFYVDEEKAARGEELVKIAADLVAEAMSKPAVMISGVSYPSKTIIKRLYELNIGHYEHVLDNLKANTQPIRNVKHYMRSALMNAPKEAKIKFQSEFNRDFPQYTQHG